MARAPERECQRSLFKVVYNCIIEIIQNRLLEVNENDFKAPGTSFCSFQASTQVLDKTFCPLCNDT